jgi:glutamine amidotransferase
MIAIIDYGSGNISAIAAIYKNLGIAHAIVSDISALSGADRYILPGVGNFDYTMNQIRNSGLSDLLREQVHGKKKPILGICVGMQLLANTSEEGSEQGLGYIEGRVQRIRTSGYDVRLPHMGWNSVIVEHDPLGLFEGVDPTMGFYFLHNYHFIPENGSAIMATTHYGGSITCAVSNNRNVFGVQFHPEKSHDNGIQLFRNFSQL